MSKKTIASLSVEIESLKSALIRTNEILTEVVGERDGAINDIGEIMKALGLPDTANLEDILAHIKGKGNSDIVYSPSHSQTEALKYLEDTLNGLTSGIKEIGQFLADLTGRKWSAASATAIRWEIRNSRLEFVIQKEVYLRDTQKWLSVLKLIKKTVTAEGLPFRYEFHNGRQIISLK